MGLLSNLFGKASGKSDFSTFNNNVYQISWSTSIAESVDVFLNGELVRTIYYSDIVISNKDLHSDWFYRLRKNDRIATMSDAYVSESAGLWYIKCTTWVPVADCQFPSRIPIAGPISKWLNHSQAFVRYDSDRNLNILTPSGELDVLPDVYLIDWYGVPMDDKYSWYTCIVDRLGEQSYSINVEDKTPSDTAVIIDGLYDWDPDELMFV